MKNLHIFPVLLVALLLGACGVDEHEEKVQKAVEALDQKPQIQEQQEAKQQDLEVLDEDEAKALQEEIKKQEDKRVDRISASPLAGFATEPEKLAAYLQEKVNDAASCQGIAELNEFFITCSDDQVFKEIYNDPDHRDGILEVFGNYKKLVSKCAGK
ncbi:MAG: hypothetical protein KA408_05545 [Flavobacteriales bacterium]|nr:hypothetical protein [Flavobacteriales bacterium]